MGNLRRKQCGKAECKRRYNADRSRETMRRLRADGERGEQYREYDRQHQRKRLEAVGHWRVVYPERAARYDALRRARVQAATVTAAAFAPRDVLARDGWACQLCRRPIDPAIPWPDPRSPSIDHIVPLSRGGQHSLANVQAAHLGCNSAKGDRCDGDQVGQPVELIMINVGP